MKKLMTAVLTLVMVLTLAACGGKTAAENEITKLYDEGFECWATTACETEWRGLFMKEGSYDVIYKVIAPMTAKQYEAYSNIEFDDEKAEEKQRAILGALTDVIVENIADMVPTQEELDAYVGKTIGDMEADGFENTGWTGEPETGYSFFYDGPVYYCRVTPTEGTVIEDMDDYSANDIRAMEIGAVEFLGISSYILDQ